MIVVEVLDDPVLAGPKERLGHTDALVAVEEIRMAEPAGPIRNVARRGAGGLVEAKPGQRIHHRSLRGLWIRAPQSGKDHAKPQEGSRDPPLPGPAAPHHFFPPASVVLNMAPSILTADGGSAPSPKFLLG